MHERERILQRYAASQHAAVARRQLRRDGWTDSQIDHQVAIGRLIIEFDGVYRVSGAPVTWNQRMLAACLYTGGDVLDNRALGDQSADGMLEPTMAALCRRFEIPMPTFQVWVSVGGTWRRMDFADVNERIDFEVDGYEHHGGNYVNWEDDLDRDAELTADGWQVVRFSWTAVNHHSARVARQITEIRRQRRRALGAA